MVAGAGSRADALFMTSPKKDSDEGLLSALAERVPKIRRTADAAENNRRMIIRSAMQNVIRYLGDHPESAVDVWQSLDSALIVGASDSKKGGRAGSSAEWEASRTSWGKLPTDYLAGWLCSLPGGPSKSMLDRIDSQDGEAVRDIFTMATQLRRTDAIPKPCLKKALMAKVLAFRFEHVGPRLTGWFAESVDAQGGINWSKCPLFALTWEGPRLASVSHKLGDVATIPEHVHISREYKFGFDDQGARFELAPVVFHLKDFFGAGLGPNRFVCDKKGRMMASLVDRAKGQLQEEEEIARRNAAAADCDVTLTTRQSQKREAALEKARDSLNKRGKRQRELVLTSAST